MKTINTTSVALTALAGSIIKWSKIVKAFKDVEGTSNDPMYEENGCVDCPLCVSYADVDGCNGCPIKEDTGYRGCVNTPYDDWADDLNGDEEQAGETQENAEAMLTYLVNLQKRCVVS